MHRSSSPYVGHHGANMSPPSYRASPVPSMYDQESLLGMANAADTSFELMSATQLREQLRREQSKRRETEAEVAALKKSTDVTSPAHAPNPLLSRARVNGGLQQDSDSGFSYAHSASRRSPTHQRPLSPIMNTADRPRDTHAPGFSPSKGFRHSSPIHGSASHQDLSAWMDIPASGALTNLRDAMYESEQRRLALVEKLKEAHETLQQQTDRLIGSETKLNDTHHTIEGLNVANQSLQKKIIDLEKGMEHSMSEKIDSFRNRERLQNRVEELERELKNQAGLQASLRAEQTKRDLIVDQTSRAVSLVEEENRSLKQTKETMMKESLALRDSLNILRAKNDKLESASKELDRNRQRVDELMHEVSDLRSRLSSGDRTVEELNQQMEDIKDQLRRANQERDLYQRQASEAQDRCGDLNSRCISATAAKERYQAEKLDMQQAMRQALAEKEHEQSMKQSLDAKLTEMQLEVTQRKLAAERAEDAMEKMSEELQAVKKVCEVLSSELAAAKEGLEQTQEELRNTTADKRSAQQQQSYWEGEAKRIAGERDNLAKSLEMAKDDFASERDQLEEKQAELKELVKGAKNEKNKYSTRCQELETMLQRANEDLKTTTERHQQEMEEWKTNCDRLSSNLGRKDSEVTELGERFQEAHKQISELKVNLQDAVTQQEKLVEFRDEADKLKQENERLVQEHGEDQQVINLLEMQKNILTQSQTSGVPKHNAEQMQADIDHLRAELGLAEDKIAELREELASREGSRQPEAGGDGVIAAWSARNTPAPCERCVSLLEQVNNLKQMNQLLSEQQQKLEATKRLISGEFKPATNGGEVKDLLTSNRSLEDLNNLLNQKISRLEKEKAELSIARDSRDTVTKAQYDQLQSEKNSVELDYQGLKYKYAELENRHKHCSSEQRPLSLDTSSTSPVRLDQVETSRKYKQENDILQRQIELLRSQCVLADNGRKRAEDKTRDLEKNNVQLQHQLSEEREKNLMTPEMEATLRTQIRDRDDIIKQLQMDVATKNVALDNCHRDNDNRITEKRREIERLQQEREEWATLRRRLEQEKVALEIKVQELQLLLDQSRGRPDPQVTQLEEEAHQANKDLKRLEIDVKNLQEQLSQKDQELAALRLNSGAGEGVSDMKREIERKNQEYRDILQEKTRTELELEKVRTETSRTVEHLTSIVERQESELGSLQQNGGGIEAASKDMEELMEKRREEYENILAKKESLIAALREKIDGGSGLKQSMDEVEQELFEVRSELQRVNGTIKLKESQLEEQESALAQAQSQNQQLQKEVKSLKKNKGADVEERDEIITDLQNKLDEKIQEIGALQDLNKSVENMKGSSDGRIKKLEDKVKEQIDEIQGLNKQMSSLQTRNRKLDQNNGVLQKEVEELKEAKSQCKKCDQLKGQFDDVSQQKDSLEEENDELNREVERLESLLNIHMRDAKQEQTPASILKSKIPLKDSSRLSSRQSSGVATPEGGTTNGKGGAANPKQLAQALRRLSLKPGSDEPGKARDIPKSANYDESKRSALSDLEARMQRLSSNQQQSMKDLRRSSLKPPESDSGSESSRRSTSAKKQAHFVLPPSKKFDKSPASSLTSSLKRGEKN